MLQWENKNTTETWKKKKKPEILSIRNGKSQQRNLKNK